MDLHLIDFNNWIYKFKSVYSVNRRLESGIIVNMAPLFGAIRSLKSNKFNKIYLCLDAYPVINLNLLPSYKGNRGGEPNEQLFINKNELIRIISSIGKIIGKDIKVVAIPGCEADQVISTIVEIVNNGKINRELYDLTQIPIKEDLFFKNLRDVEEIDLELQGIDNIIISSTDSDIYQLLRYDNVFIDDSTNGSRINYNRSTPVAVGQVEGFLIPLYKTLMGDQSDNIMPLVKIKNIKEWLRSNFKDYNSVLSFVAAVSNGEKQDVKKQELIDFLMKKQLNFEFLRRFKLTHLTIHGNPKQLEFSNFDVYKVIEDYQISI